MSSEFDKARQEIERIKREAEQKRVAKETAEAQKEVEKILAEEKRKEREMVHAANLEFVIKNTPSYLQKVNKELFANKGRIEGWKEVTDTYVVKHQGPGGWDDGTWVEGSVDYVTYSQNRFKIEIILPDNKAVTIFIPLQTGKHRIYTKNTGFFGNKRTEKTVIYWQEPTREEDKQVFISPQILNLQNPDLESLSSELTSSIIKSAIDLHK